MKTVSCYIFILITFFSCNSAHTENSEIEWKELFNGKDMNDWIIKIAKHDLNENYAQTFRVEDGLLKVRYDGYVSFDQQYGHIFFKEPFSHYVLKVEYRFVGEQAPGGEGWAYRNSGAMLHCLDPSTMLRDQDFPISIEGQLLGGDGINERSTSNLCTPGTNVVIDGELFTPHCMNSSSKTYHGDQWVTAEFLVLGDSIIHHILEGVSVISYGKPQIGGGNVSPFDPDVKVDGTPLTSGYISLQSESHPIDFRKVVLADLSGVKNNKSELNAALVKLGYGAFTED
jgi:hypothetical protein